VQVSVRPALTPIGCSVLLKICATAPAAARHELYRQGQPPSSTSSAFFNTALCPCLCCTELCLQKQQPIPHTGQRSCPCLQLHSSFYAWLGSTEPFCTPSINLREGVIL
jgi:hypothetical protein